MESEEFNKLTKEQAEEGFRLCTENASVHFEMAELIAKKKHFPMANSHLILAAEEATKALFLYFKYQLNNIEIPVKSMFKRHSHKHEFAKDNYEYFHQNLVKILSKIDKSNQNAFTDKYFNELTEQSFVESEMQNSVMQLFEMQFKRIKSLNIEESLPNIHKWFNKADLNKSRGFYSDFVNKQWKTPSVITEEDYNLSKFLSWNLVLFAKILLGTGAKIQRYN